MELARISSLRQRTDFADAIAEISGFVAGSGRVDPAALVEAINEVRYEPHDRAVVATASPRVVNARVRGGT